MKAVNFFLLPLASVAVIVALTFSSQALADCGKKSKKMSMNKMSDMRDMGMTDDMPMCCKMKMDHKHAKGDDNETGANPMESTGDHGMPSEPDQKKGQGATKQSTQIKDPVCSMTVDPKTAEKSVYKGKTYYFCSKDDKETLEKAPEKYLKQDRKSKQQ